MDYLPWVFLVIYLVVDRIIWQWQKRLVDKLIENYERQIRVWEISDKQKQSAIEHLYNKFVKKTP